MSKTINTKILNRRDTSANWTLNNPVLASGEIGYDTTAKKIKIGDGTSTWSNLPYIASDVYVGPEAPTDPGIDIWIDSDEAGDNLVTDVQVNGASVVTNGVANVPVASASRYGVAKVSGAMGVEMTNGYLTMSSADSGYISQGQHARKAITPFYQHESTFYGLAKAAGDTTQSASSNTVGMYTDEAKQAIKEMIGVSDPLVDDVQINGTSIVNNGVANIPIANQNTLGTVKVNSNYGVMLYNNMLAVSAPVDQRIKVGTDMVAPVVASNQHKATFYGLAKAAGDTTQSASSNAVGTYTDEAKSAIKTMLGVTDPSVDDVKINGSSIVNEGVANIPVASSTEIGAIKVEVQSTSGLTVDPTTKGLRIASAGSSAVKAQTSSRVPITPYIQHESVFYGLATAAGDTTQSASNNAVGTYTDEAKTAIKNMIGVEDPAVNDVQINGTSVVTDGVAEIPIAIANGDYGLVKLGADGVEIASTGSLGVRRATTQSQYKSANDGYRFIPIYYQHMATFYGLAKAAGDSTQSASSNAVGTYTDEAKEKIHSMFNIADASAFGIVCNGETASRNIIKGQYVIWNGKLYIALVDISSGTTLSVGNLVAVNDGFFNAIALPKVYACYTAEEDMQSITLDFGFSYSFDVYDELVIVIYQSDTTQTNFCNGNWSYVYIKNNNNYAITQTSALYLVGNQPNMIRLKRTPTGIFGNIINTTYSIKPIFVPKSADDELLVSNILCNKSGDNVLLTGTRIEAFLGRM